MEFLELWDLVESKDNNKEKDNSFYFDCLKKNKTNKKIDKNTSLREEYITWSSLKNKFYKRDDILELVYEIEDYWIDVNNLIFSKLEDEVYFSFNKKDNSNSEELLKLSDEVKEKLVDLTYLIFWKKVEKEWVSIDDLEQ